MGNVAPIILAYILNLSGVYIYREIKTSGSEILISSIIFLTAIFVLLFNVRLYPAELRKLWRSGAMFFNFTVSAFIMEVLMNDFWWPLETSFISFLPKIADFEQQLIKLCGLSFGGILQVLRSDIVGALTSYILSIFFLLCALHGTRAIDLNLLRCGPGVFFHEVFSKMRKSKRRFLMYFGLKKKRVYFNPKCCKPPDYDEFYDEGRLPPRRRYQYHNHYH